MTPLVRRAFWTAQPLVIALALWLSLGGPARDVRDPLLFSGDGLMTLVQARLILDGGSWWATPDLTTPRGGDSLLLPRNAHVDQALLRLARLASRRVSAVVTMAWVLMLLCAGASCAWCLRRLGVSMAGAWSAGVLFALSPFALSHNTSSLDWMPYLVPFAATAALQLATGRSAAPGWRGLLAGNVALGLNTIYFAVFGAFFVSVGAIAGIVRGRRRADIRRGAVMLAAIALATAVNLAPNYLAGRHGEAPGEARVSPAEAELHGLKIRQLISPPPDHWFGPLRRWSELNAQARFPDGGEPPGTRLGVIAAIGFLGLIGLVLIPTAAGPGDEGETLRGASRLTLAAIIVATVGGLNSVFNLLISPIVRDYTAVTAFLAFLSLAALALGIDRATQARIRLRGALWAGLVIFGVADQAVALRPVIDGREAVSESFTEVREFVSAAEGALPAGARVFQLPIWPEGTAGRLERAQPTDRFKPFVVSRRLQWSYPAVSADQIRALADAAAVSPGDLPAHLKRQGYAAIMVDRFGYHDDGTEILAALQTVPSAARPIALNRRYVALDIREP